MRYVSSTLTLLATGIGLCLANALPAKADVVYTVFNPSRHFTLFVYDSPAFITTDTTIAAAQLIINPLNDITSVDFIPVSSTGTSELDVFETSPPPPEQSRYYPLGTFARFGVTPGGAGSFGGSNSLLRVAAPEPGTFALLGVGLVGLFGLRRRAIKGCRLARKGGGYV